MDQKEKNRKAMPQVTAWIDEMRECFPELTVTYAKEGGMELGQPPERGYSNFQLDRPSVTGSLSVKPDRKGVRCK